MRMTVEGHGIRAEETVNAVWFADDEIEFSAKQFKVYPYIKKNKKN